MNTSMKQFLLVAIMTATIISGCKKDNDSPPTVPLVTTAALTNVNISSGTATGGGSIVSDGGAMITKSGIIWSKLNNTPTLTDSTVTGTTGTGTFIVNITGLDFNNTYYFRAFATNSAGTGYGSVVTLATSGDSVKFTYNGQSVTYGIIISPTTAKKWLDRNIGAKKTADSAMDYNAYGDLFQWGRPADGHQLINWTTSTAGTAAHGTTTVVATSDVPGHSNFIIAPDDGSSNYDWRSNNNINRWATSSQGPCPAGWHVPTSTEWAAEVSNTQAGGTATSGGITNISTAHSQLKLVVSGRRRGYGTSSGQFHRTGIAGAYWSSTIITSFYTKASKFESFSTNVQVITDDLSAGSSIRCIKD